MLDPRTIEVGDVVTYEDRANPLHYYEVTAVTDNQWSTFHVRSLTTGARHTTDGRQNGWQVPAYPVVPADDSLPCAYCENGNYHVHVWNES